MQTIARSVEEQLPKGWGFFLFVAPFEENQGRANYCSTMTRETAIHAMKEFIIKAGAGEDWMKHI